MYEVYRSGYFTVFSDEPIIYVDWLSQDQIPSGWWTYVVLPFPEPEPDRYQD